MKHLDLFSGIGGFSLALDWVYGDMAKHIFCEIDPFCRAVLSKHWPGAKIYGDIKKLKGSKVGTVDIVTGGFPCQPFSQAGKRLGTQDDRHLWPEMLRVIREVQPTWIVGENVVGIISMAFIEILNDLEGEGYEVQPFVIPACAVDAPHKRDRLWIVAHSNSVRRSGMDQKQQKKTSSIYQKGFSRWRNFEDSLRMDFIGILSTKGGRLKRNDDGLSKGMDRLKAVGNAIVPQVAAEIFKTIKTIENL